MIVLNENFKNLKINFLVKKSIILTLAYFSSLLIGNAQEKNLLEDIRKLSSHIEQLEVLETALQKNQLSNPKVMYPYARAYDSIAKLHGVEKVTIKAINFQGNAHYANEDYDKALDYYLQAAKILEQKESSKTLSEIYNNMAGCYRVRKDFENTKKYFIKALVIAEDLKDYPWIANLKNNLAVIYMDESQFEKADEMYEDALLIYEEAKDTLMMGITFMNQGNSRIFSENYDEAITKYELAEKYVSISVVPLLHAVSQTGIGIAHTSLNNYDEALPFLKNGIFLSKKINHTEQLMESYVAMSKYYAQTSDYESAFIFQERAQKIKDSITSGEQDKNLADALTKYETEKKEREITAQRLLILENKRQKNQILFGLVALGILLIGVFIFFRNRIKYQKTISKQNSELQKQKIIELQQENKIISLDSMIEGQEKERARIAQDLHDSLGGLLSSVKSHFQSTQIQDDGTAQRVAKTTSLIDTAASEVRRISHNMMPQALAVSGLEGAITDLAERLKVAQYEVTLEYKQLPPLDNNQEIMIYRLVQELISNIKKHADARSVFIQLYAINNHIYITVEDDGKGFDDTAVNTKEGLGIQGVRSRVAYLDGEILWDSEIGKGTTVDINFSIN